jgi:hypothetical protein
LYYQQTSWEYIQFLWLQNDRQSSFLGDEGVNLLDAWLNTGMAEPLELELTTVDVSASAGPPGEASDPAASGEQMTASYDEATGRIDVSYVPACDSQNHNIYYGDLSLVSSYAWDGAECDVGSSGSASFDPQRQNAFFVVVAHDSVLEGPYGLASDGSQRPEDVGTANCDYPQDLASVCDPQ